MSALKADMAILVFVLSFLLLIGAAASAYQSIDLLPTGIGVLYALMAAVAVSSAVITFAIGVAIRRIDALTELMRRTDGLPGTVETALSDETHVPDADFPASPAVPAADLAIEATPARVDEASMEDESPININRAGHLPSLEAIETVLEEREPRAPPALIGSYSSAGANYKIFDDGSIEAETDEGTFKFASMTDFKRHLVERGKARTEPLSE
jgi:hypothetical protein